MAFANKPMSCTGLLFVALEDPNEFEIILSWAKAQTLSRAIWFPIIHLSKTKSRFYILVYRYKPRNPNMMWMYCIPSHLQSCC